MVRTHAKGRDTKIETRVKSRGERLLLPRIHKELEEFFGFGMETEVLHEDPLYVPCIRYTTNQMAVGCSKKPKFESLSWVRWVHHTC